MRVMSEFGLTFVSSLSRDGMLFIVFDMCEMNAGISVSRNYKDLIIVPVEMCFNVANSMDPTP